MFKKDEELYDEVETVIGPSVKVEGDFVAAGNIVVEGVVSGSIKTDKDLRIGEKAQIFANVSVGNAFVSGEVHGNIKTAGSLELSSTAKVIGDIKTKTLVIASGAVVRGKCSSGDPKHAKAEKPKDITKTPKEQKASDDKKSK